MKIYLTKKGYQKLFDELNHLLKVENKESLQMLHDARDKGDISENEEYEKAKEHHERLTDKIKNIKEKLQNSEIISPFSSGDKVERLSTVIVKNLKTEQVLNWCLVPENEVDVKNGKISFNSPIGSSLLGKKIGEKLEVKVPIGVLELEILNIDFKYTN